MEVPGSIRSSLCTKRISKGDIQGQLKFYAWDILPSCRGHLCPAYIECSYLQKKDVGKLMEKRERGEEVQLPGCMVMEQYLMSTVDIIFRNYADSLNEAQLYRIGMGLIPAYRQLCRLQLEELGLVSVLYSTDKGDPRIHPLLAAIREQSVVIEKMWNSIGLSKLDNEQAGKDSNVYDIMNREATAKIRNKRANREST